MWSSSVSCGRALWCSTHWSSFCWYDVSSIQLCYGWRARQQFLQCGFVFFGTFFQHGCAPQRCALQCGSSAYLSVWTQSSFSMFFNMCGTLLVLHISVFRWWILVYSGDGGRLLWRWRMQWQWWARWSLLADDCRVLSAGVEVLPVVLSSLQSSGLKVVVKGGQEKLKFRKMVGGMYKNSSECSQSWHDSSFRSQ